MKLIHTIAEMLETTAQAHASGKVIGFVPTMGALHEGHITLVKRAREECSFVVVSVFVNPTQFGPSEDYGKYPRTLDADVEKCSQAGVDVVFAPSAEEMYPNEFNSWVDVKGPTDILEGLQRSGHFRGVTTVCNKFFNITQADRAYFGKKDYQQLVVITKMVRELNMQLEIVPVETVREADGLAMSSRNAYLSDGERLAALALSKGLKKAREAFVGGERRAALIKHAAEYIVRAEPLARIDYVAVVDAETLRPIENIERPTALLLAVRIGGTRLIDNTILEP